MNNKRISDIKRAQKESLLLRTISKLFLEVTRDNKDFMGFFVNRVELSPDKGHCSVYFCTMNGLDEFAEKLEKLKLYKPSMRAALSREINGRYTPNLRFKFDTCQEKVHRIDELLENLKNEGDL
jgi:ribosome-binding factor A